MRTYLLASFPSLSFGSAPSLSLDDFLFACGEHLSKSDLRELNAACSNPDQGTSAFAKEWAQVKAQSQTFNQQEREQRLSQEKPEPFFMESDQLRSQNEQAWLAADPLLREQALLRSLWDWIENQRRKAPFTLTDVMGYALQLQLIDRKSMWNESAGQIQFKEHTQTFLEPVLEELRKQELSV